VDVKDVRNGFGEGRVVGSKQAVRLGMADRIETFDQTVTRIIEKMSSGSTNQQGRSAEHVNLTPEADSSDPIRAEKERQAQSLRERVNNILDKGEESK